MSVKAPTRGGLDIVDLLERSGIVIYIALATLFVWGLYNVFVSYRTLSKKSLSDKKASELIGQVREHLAKGNVKAAMEVCVNPANWHSALAQLMAVALRNRDKGLAKIKQLLVLEFHTEIVGQMENRVASIATAARMGPLLGLLGTVVSMIAAFGRMGGGTKPDPAALAGAISIGLWATGAGLLLANPLMVIGNDVQARLRRLRDRTEKQLMEFVEVIESSESPNRASRPSMARAVLPR